jgi:hypothetical protein
MVSLKNSFLYWRSLVKDKGEGAHSTHPRCECGKSQGQIVSTCLTPHPALRATFPPTFGMGEGFGLLNIQRCRLTYPIAVRSCADYLFSIYQRQVQRTLVR